MKKVCCVCRKAKGKKGWNGKEVEKFKEVIFGICPPCYSDALVKIKENYSAPPNQISFIMPRNVELAG